MAQFFDSISIAAPENDRDRAELSKLVEFLDRSPTEINRSLQKVVQAILAGQSISIVAQDKYLSLEAAAKQLNISDRALLQSIEQGKILTYTLEGQTVIKSTDLETYQQERDKIRAENLQKIISMTEEEGGYEDEYIKSVMASMD